MGPRVRAPVHRRAAPRFRVGHSPAGDSALFGRITKDGIVEVLREARRDRTRMAQGEEGRPRRHRRARDRDDRLAARPAAPGRPEGFRQMACPHQAIRDYPSRFASTVSKNSANLPRRGGSDVRVVPRLTINKSEREFWQSFDKSQELANLKGGPELRAFFFDEMVRQLEQAFSAAAQKSSPTEPLQTADRWVIGFDPDYEWNGMPGHYYDFTFYSNTAATAEKKEKKAAKEKATQGLAETQDWLGKLSTSERQQLAAKL
jgi:hypothetical protein